MSPRIIHLFTLIGRRIYGSMKDEYVRVEPDEWYEIRAFVCLRKDGSWLIEQPTVEREKR